MKLRLFLLSTVLGLLGITSNATVHNVNVANFAFTPNTLTIMQGDTVVWTNTSGSHNVNGSTATFPSNPASIGPNAVGTGWTFTHVFTVAGSYSYQCDPHAPGMSASITVTPVARDLVLTAVYDGTLSGGNPKGIEIYALNNIADLSSYGIGSANNGGGTDGVEFTFPAVSVNQGDYIYVTTDSTAFNSFFGFSADYVGGSAVGINGDDAMELFNNGIVIDVFGDINTDGTGQPWEYLDSWAYRKQATGPDSSNFILNNWTYGGINVYDPVSTNAAASPSCPIGTYSPIAPVVPTVDFASTSVTVSEGVGSVQVDILINPAATAADTVDLVFALGSGITLPADGSISPLPNLVTGLLRMPVASGDDTISFTVNIVDDAVIESNETLFVAITSLTSGLINGNDTSMILVVRDNDFRTSDIATLTTNDANFVPDSLGVTLITYGVVYTGDLDGNNGHSFYIQDNTGGVNVFNFNDVSGYVVTPGDSIMVRGQVAQFRGLTEIIPDSIAVLKSNATIDGPRTVSVLDETTEGEFIQLECFKFVDTTQWNPGSGSGFNVQITNGVDTFTMRVDNDVNLFNQPLPTTGLFTVRGAGAQFTFSSPANDGYQIFPRDTGDIILINEVSIDVASTNDASLVPVELGNKHIVTGVVYTDDFDGNNGYSFYIYDNTGGINVFNFNDVSGYTVTRGDSIRVIGDIAQFRGLTEIIADSIEVLKQGVTIAAPRAVSVLDETTEGEFIELSGWNFVDTAQWTTGSGNGGFNVQITNGIDTFTMRIDSDIDLYNKPVPTTGVFDVRGAGAQFTFSSPANDGYQIFPRDSADIVINVSLPEVSALNVDIYPNPADDVFFIRRANSAPATITLSTVTGGILRRFESTDRVIQVGTADLSKGVYLIAIESDGASTVERVVIR